MSLQLNPCTISVQLKLIQPSHCQNDDDIRDLLKRTEMGANGFHGDTFTQVRLIELIWKRKIKVLNLNRNLAIIKVLSLNRDLGISTQ